VTVVFVTDLKISMNLIVFIFLQTENGF